VNPGVLIEEWECSKHYTNALGLGQYCRYGKGVKKIVPTLKAN